MIKKVIITVVSLALVARFRYQRERVVGEAKGGDCH